MNDLIQLTEAEIAGVSGGTYQSIDIDASQSNSSSVTQGGTATNSGAVSASVGSYSGGATAAAVGASVTNTAIVYQSNRVSASNSVRFSFYH